MVSSPTPPSVVIVVFGLYEMVALVFLVQPGLWGFSLQSKQLAPTPPMVALHFVDQQLTRRYVEEL